MNINRQGSMNDIVGIDAEPVLNRENSLNELSRNPTVNSIQPQQQYFEVIQKKQQEFGEEDDYKKFINKIKSEQKYIIPQLNKDNIKKKQSKKEQELAKSQKIQEQSKKEKLLKIIEPHIRNYKTLNNPNQSDTEVNKLRAENRQKIFKFLMYGIQELKLLKQQQLSEQEKRITKLTLKDPYLLAKSLTTEIDIQFLKNLNNDNKQVISKKYKSFIKTFTSNIAQQSNLILRRKILTRQYSGKKLAIMKQQDFYPAHIRQKIIERQNILLREAAAQEKPVTNMPQENEYFVEPVIVPVVQKKQEQKKQKYKYLDESSILMIKDFLNPQQITRMRNILEFQNRKDIQERLVGNLNKVFDNLM